MTEEQRKSLKVGDKIRCIEGKEVCTKGKIYTIATLKNPSFMEGPCFTGDGSETQRIGSDGIYIHAFELVNPEPEFKVGDEVVVVKNINGERMDFMVGKIGTIINVSQNNQYTLSNGILAVAEEIELVSKVQTHKTEDSNMSESRSARKRDLKENIIPAKEDAVAEAELELENAKDELKRLVANKTDHAETIADIVKAKKVTSEEAEAILRLSKGVGIQV